MQALAGGVLGDEPLELGDHARVSAERQVGIEPQLERLDAELFQACDLAVQRVLECEIGKRRATPEPQRLVEDAPGIVRLASRERGAALLDGSLEAVKVNVTRRDPELV